MREFRKILMVLNGEMPDCSLFENSLFNSEFLIGVDGGANWLIENGLEPNLILGDLDSLSPENLRITTSEIVKLDNQDFTDFEKSLEFLCSNYSFQGIEIWGATGKRFDHTLANLSTLKKFSRKAQITICDNYSESFLIFGNSTFSGEIGQQVSLTPISVAKGVTLEGFKYNLLNSDLKFGERVSSSNQFSQNEVNVEIEKGCLLVTKIRLGKE